MSFRKIEVKPIAGALGAEIEGVDLGQPLDDETFGEIRQAFLDHQVIFLRDQNLTPESHMVFARRFGELDIHPFAAGLSEHPEVMPVVKEASDRAGNFGGTWHSDVTFYEKPALGSILYALEAPPYGGDTMFASMYLAYETLSDGMKALLDGLTALHNASRAYGLSGRTYHRYGAGSKSMKVRIGEDADETVEHPVIRTHPETGRKALFVNHVFTRCFKGWTEEESEPLLQYLYAHAVRPEFTCRFRWRSKSVAFWDNRCVMHHALNDYHGFRREMHRVTVCGDRPFLARDGEVVAAAE
ncbi:MAG: TauD/TfdA family dioxygenase [Alphaproteobacteria bacterium]|nr:TauD/TfdA family dioxygenase [Alphaproteobacteria bacterium]